MLKKSQKIWLTIFGAMFLIPEILFFTTPLFILSFINNFSETKLFPPIYYIISQQFFTNHPNYLLLAIGIEWLGLLGLFIMSIKVKKIILITVFAILLIWIFIVFGLTNMFIHMEWPI